MNKTFTSSHNVRGGFHQLMKHWHQHEIRWRWNSRVITQTEASESTVSAWCLGMKSRIIHRKLCMVTYTNIFEQKMITTWHLAYLSEHGRWAQEIPVIEFQTTKFGEVSLQHVALYQKSKWQEISISRTTQISQIYNHRMYGWTLLSLVDACQDSCWLSKWRMLFIEFLGITEVV